MRLIIAAGASFVAFVGLVTLGIWLDEREERKVDMRMRHPWKGSR